MKDQEAALPALNHRQRAKPKIRKKESSISGPHPTIHCTWYYKKYLNI